MKTLRRPDGTALAYDDCGTGPAVLLVHGWGTSRLVWRGVVEGSGLRPGRSGG